MTTTAPTTATGVARMTITLPAAMKEQIDAAADVNWSGLAAVVFRQKLTELQAGGAAETMAEALVRLRAGIQLEASQDYTEGQESGREWAMKAAKPKHLRRMDEAGVDIDAIPEEGRVETLVAVMEPDEESEYDRDALRIQLEGYISAAQAESSDYVAGFIGGATYVWDQV